jgi:REP element-mobilizing transposase RayT
MPRPLRAEIEAGVHHVFARGVARQAVFIDTTDRQKYLAMLAHVTRRMSWHCLTYCLMGNHLHLLLETRQPNLNSGMQRLHGQYAQALNRRHRRSGHLFQGRFGWEQVRDDAQLWATVRYIVNNPVKDGFCEAPELWPWSSHAAIIDGTAPSWLDEARLFSYFASDGGDPRRRYADLVKGVRPL